MNKLDDLKREYESIEIPKDLDEIINKTIVSNTNLRKKKKFTTLVSSAAALALLVLPLNLIPSFANSLSEIPVIADIARVFTIKTYIKQSENIELDVTQVALTDLSDKNYQDKINSVIEEKIEVSLSEATLRAAEYKEAYIETGGSEESFKEKNMKVKVDYKIYSNSNNVLSFLVFSHESLAAVYAEYSYYNINVENNTNITLSDLLGDDFQAIITSSVLNDINYQKEKGEILFFDNVNSPDFTVRSDIDFYINNNNDLVLVFEKYEIAAGSFGRLEYTIKI